MIFFIDSFQFAHESRSSADRCLVYNRVGMIGRVIHDEIGLLGFAGGRYFVEWK